MSETIKEHKLEILIGLFLLGGIIAWLVIPMSWQDTTIILEGGGGGAPVSCLPSGGLVLAQNLTDLCDVTIISPTTNQLIEYNGSQWVNVDSAFITTNTTCVNLGNEIISKSAFICADDTDNILSFKNIVRGDGIGIDFNTTSIIVQNNTPESSTCVNSTALAGAFELCEFEGDLQLDGEIFIKLLDNGTGITITDNGEILTVTNSLPEATTASNLGSVSTLSEGVFASEVLNDLQFKKLLEGTSIELSSNSTHITITNTAPDNTVCANVGSATAIYKDGECNFKTLVGSPDISITNTTNTVVIDYNGTHVTSLTSADTATLSYNASSGNILATPTLKKLCEFTGVGGETSIACTFSSSQQQFWFTVHYNSTVTNTVWELRFNNDTGNNYAYRSSTNGAADATATNTDSISVQTITANQNNGIFMQCHDHSSTMQKFCNGDRMNIPAGSSTAPSRVEITGFWNNISSQITSINLTRTASTGTLNAGSHIIVWGYS